MCSPLLVRAVVLFAALTVTAQAEAVRPTTKRLPDWLDALLRTIESRTIPYESITLTVPEETDAKSDRAKVEVVSPEKFFRLAPLVELRAGTADMRNLTAPGGPRRSGAEFEVALEAPTIREGDLDRLKGAAEDLGALVDHLRAEPTVHVGQFIASRPMAITIFGQPVQRVPVRVTLIGPRAEVLSRLAELAKPLPYAYLRGLRATPGTPLSVAVSLNLLVKPADAQKATGTAEELQKLAAEKVAAAAGPDAKVSISTSPGAEIVILSVKGTAKDVAAARDALVAVARLPGLRAYDELGWKNGGAGVQVTGLLTFER